MSMVDIIIPTFNNPKLLNECVNSLGGALFVDLAKLIIVNNGEKGSVGVQGPGVTLLEPGRNLGWEGGLKLALEHSKSPYVCFLNDDVYFPTANQHWLHQMLQHFRHPDVAAVGPSSNYILGAQNIWSGTPYRVCRVRYLIGLCMLIRRDYLDQAGGVDDTLPGGDDIDLSIRLRKLGKHLICDRSVFVFHHGSVTGKKVHGGDWDSIQHQERYTKALWEKHGLNEWLTTMNAQIIHDDHPAGVSADVESEMVKRYAIGDKVYELGCGDKKTCCDSVGVDIIPQGQHMEGVFNRTSGADVVADVFQPLPIENADCFVAQHILEHTHDPLGAILNWKRSLRPHGGRLVVAVPDENWGLTIPLNPQHKAAFTPESLQRLMEVAGLKTISVEPSGNNISMVGVWERNGD